MRNRNKNVPDQRKAREEVFKRKDVTCLKNSEDISVAGSRSAKGKDYQGCRLVRSSDLISHGIGIHWVHLSRWMTWYDYTFKHPSGCCVRNVETTATITKIPERREPFHVWVDSPIIFFPGEMFLFWVQADWFSPHRGNPLVVSFGVASRGWCNGLEIRGSPKCIVCFPPWNSCYIPDWGVERLDDWEES